MKISRLIPFLANPAATAGPAALACLLLAGCFGAGGKKGQSGLVVSSVDPALASNHSRVVSRGAGPVAENPAARAAADPEPSMERAGEIDVEPEPARRAEIAGAAGGFKEYTVKKGDSLWSISRDSGTSIDALRRANGLSGDKLVAGQAIRIPDPGGSQAAADADTSSAAESEEVVATLPNAAKKAPKEKAGGDLLETLPSGVVPPDPPRRSSTNLLEDESATDLSAPVKKPETTIGDDGFLRFGDE